MSHLTVKNSSVKGKLTIPPSKSQTMRALVFGMMAKGTTIIYNALMSPDTQAMVRAMRMFGAKVDAHPDCIEIEGLSGKLAPAEDVIDAGNSGLVLRLIGALAGLLPTYTVVTGDFSIRHRRVVQPLLDGLEQLGAFAKSARQDGFAPLIIRGPISPGKARISGEDSQPVSALLIAASFLEGKSELEVVNPGETPWVELTLRWLERFGIRFAREGFSRYTLFGSAALEGFTYTVPADFSSAAYPLAAALVTGSELAIENLDFQDAQGDKLLIEHLIARGARIEKEQNRLIVKKSMLQGGKVDVSGMIDATPLIAVLGCFAEGPTEVVGAKIARAKESDRITAIAHELAKMGGKIEQSEDGFIVQPAKLRGCLLHSHDDHRIALSLAVAALAAKGESKITGAGCIAKSYPAFCESFRKIGAEIGESDPVRF